MIFVKARISGVVHISPNPHDFRAKFNQGGSLLFDLSPWSLFKLESDGLSTFHQTPMIFGQMQSWGLPVFWLFPLIFAWTQVNGVSRFSANPHEFCAKRGRWDLSVFAKPHGFQIPTLCPLGMDQNKGSPGLTGVVQITKKPGRSPRPWPSQYWLYQCFESYFLKVSFFICSMAISKISSSRSHPAPLSTCRLIYGVWSIQLLRLNMTGHRVMLDKSPAGLSG